MTVRSLRLHDTTFCPVDGELLVPGVGELPRQARPMRFEIEPALTKLPLVIANCWTFGSCHAGSTFSSIPPLKPI